MDAIPGVPLPRPGDEQKNDCSVYCSALVRVVACFKGVGISVDDAREFLKERRTQKDAASSATTGTAEPVTLILAAAGEDMGTSVEQLRDTVNEARSVLFPGEDTIAAPIQRVAVNDHMLLVPALVCEENKLCWVARKGSRAFTSKLRLVLQDANSHDLRRPVYSSWEGPRL